MLFLPSWITRPLTLIHLTFGGMLCTGIVVYVTLPVMRTIGVATWSPSLQTLTVSAVGFIMTMGLGATGVGLGLAAHVLGRRLSD